MSVLRRLSSARLAAVLLGVLVALCLLSFVVPQRSHSMLSLHTEWAEENPALARIAAFTGADDVFASPPFYLVLALLAASMAACTLQRVRRRRRASIRMPGALPGNAASMRTSLHPADAAAVVRSAFPLWGRRTTTQDALTYLVLDRGFWGFVGSIVLHVGMLTLLLAGLVSGLTRFDGRLVLTVGETVADARDSYYGEVREPVVGKGHDGSTITLNSLRFDYEDGYLTQAHGFLTFRDASGSAVEEAVVNAPARWRGKSYLMVKGGHAVRVEVRDAAGAVVFSDAFVRLGRPAEGGYRDEIELSDGSRLALATTADAGRASSTIAEPLRLTDPALKVASVGAAEDESVRLRPGESASLGELSVALHAVTLWNEFAVRQDKGIPLAYMSFAIILLGSAVRFAFDRRKLGCLVTAAPGGALVNWWSSDDEAAERVRRLLAAHEIGEAS